MGSDRLPTGRVVVRLLVLAGGAACAASSLLVWWRPSGDPLQGADGLGAVVGAIGVIIALIAISRLVGYRGLDTRPAGYLGVAAWIVLTVAVVTERRSGGLGAGVWTALAGTAATVTGALLDRSGPAKRCVSLRPGRQ
jgi:hypothetical protein